MNEAVNYIENWKLCDYAYCPQLVNQLIDHKISIQSKRSVCILQMEKIYEMKKVQKIMRIIDLHNSEIQMVRGIEGNSVYLLLNYGLSRMIIKNYIFEKVDLSKLLFMRIEEIMKTLDLSIYTAHKILSSCRFALHELVDDSDPHKKEVLYSDLCDFFRGTSESFARDDILQGMLWRSGDELLNKLLHRLIGEKAIVYQKGSYQNHSIYVQKSLTEVLDSIRDETTRHIVVDRLYGKTLDAIALSTNSGLSRSRVGQIFRNEMDRFPSVKEDQYKDLIVNYAMDRNLFYAITNAMQPTWGYIQERYHSECQGSKIPINGDTLSIKIAKELCVNTKKLKEYLQKHYLYIEDVWIDKEDKAHFLQIVCKSFDGYFQKEDIEKRYNRILKEVYPEKYSDWQLNDFRISSVLKQGYLVHSAKKGIRYRIVSKDLVESVNREVRMSQYINTIISTKKIFEDHMDVMEKYDIRDQYELHSIFRIGKERYSMEANQMQISRMPMLLFGQGKESEIVKKEMRALAPIDLEDFSRIMANKYGYDIGTFLSYVRRNFNLYIEENRIDFVDEDILRSSDYNKMSTLLVDDFYFEEEYDSLLEEHHLSMRLKDPHVLRRLGYKSFVGYILKTPLAPGKYFESWICRHCSEITKRHLEIKSFEMALDRLEQKLEVFEWNRDHYVLLDSLKVTKTELQRYIDDILQVMKEGQFFTERYLQLNEYVNQRLSNTFYKSLFKSRPNIKMMMIGNRWVFVKSTKVVDPLNFFEQILEEQPGITVVGCLGHLKQYYNISMHKETLQDKLMECGFYYSKDTEKIYREPPLTSFKQQRLF